MASGQSQSLLRHMVKPPGQEAPSALWARGARAELLGATATRPARGPGSPPCGPERWLHVATGPHEAARGEGAAGGSQPAAGGAPALRPAPPRAALPGGSLGPRDQTRSGWLPGPRQLAEEAYSYPRVQGGRDQTCHDVCRPHSHRVPQASTDGDGAGAACPPEPRPPARPGPRVASGPYLAARGSCRTGLRRWRCRSPGGLVGRRLASCRGA